MDFTKFSSDSVVDLAVHNKFSAQTIDTLGFLNPFPADDGLSLVNGFQSITLPTMDFTIEDYIEGGDLSIKKINTGYVDWGELTLSRGFSTPVEGNPFYDLYFNTRFGYAYRMNFLIKVYTPSSITTSDYLEYAKKLAKSQRILYFVIKGAVLSSSQLFTDLDAESSEINIGEMSFAIEDMYIGVYDSRG